MPKTPPKPHDFNQLAASIVGAATGETPPIEAPKPKDPAAVALGAKGGAKGGKARASSLTPEQRSELSRLAAQARWESTASEDEPA